VAASGLGALAVSRVYKYLRERDAEATSKTLTEALESANISPFQKYTNGNGISTEKRERDEKNTKEKSSLLSWLRF
jgi:hypothetical protein